MSTTLITDVFNLLANPLTSLSSWWAAGRSYHILELILILTSLYIFFTRAYNPLRRPKTPSNLSPAEIEARLLSWKPLSIAEPLNTTPAEVLDARDGIHVKVNDKWVIDCVTNNFLGISFDKRVVTACQDALKKYGCGACGPRGFYGTVDVHLDCEQALASFSGTPDAILYSFGPATSPSIIPAFCKRGDVIVVDKGVNFHIQSGVALSRAKVVWYEHNNMEELEQVLKSIVSEEQMKREEKVKVHQRRFIVTEAISAYHGDVAPLDVIVELKKKFRFRLILDESFSLGVLGESGKGALQEYGIDRKDVEISSADLANAVATVGGYCVGEVGVVSHQRLSGAGYCFSASQPPFMAVAVTKALEIIEQDGKVLVEKLRRNIRRFREILDLDPKENSWYIDGNQKSPLMHIRSRKALNYGVFERIKGECLKNGVLVGVPKYVANEKCAPNLSIRVTISAAHSIEDVSRAAAGLKIALAGIHY